MRLFQALALSALLAILALAGCSAAPAPCIVQRPPLGGFTIEFHRDGGTPAGCTDVDVLGGGTADGPSSPTNWVDNLRFDVYFGNKIVFKSDTLPFDVTTDADGGALADSALVATAAQPLPTDPTPTGGQLLCSATNFNTLSGFPPAPVLGVGGDQGLYAITVNDATFLSGATYQGAQVEVNATITFGTCTANYQGIGVTPSALLNIAPACRVGDDTPCSPFANPDAGFATGSGYNPDFPITCRGDIGEFFVFGPPPYCLSPNDDGSCDPANVDPDTRQMGVCFLPKGATFPALK
jgi:hypothetical protein